MKYSINETSLIGGIEKPRIEILDYQPIWPQIFEEHGRAIAAALGEIALRIFRNRLRTSADDRRLYEQTKRTLAAKSWPSVDAYAQAKTEVISRIIEAAPPDSCSA